jgi:hypothetical protein
VSLTVNTTSETITTPTTPSGPTDGNTGTSYAYSTGGSSSSFGHNIQYLFDWRDGTDSGWLPVGQTSASHIWPVTGTYHVRVQTRSSTDTTILSAWSTPFSVTISGPPVSEIIYVARDGSCAGKIPCFSSIQGGINAANNSATIEITQETYDENVVLNSPKEVTLRGGWDLTFTTIQSNTTINGSLTISGGKLIVENIILE